MLKLNKFKNVDKPARYIGSEARQVIKNKNWVTNRVCVSVPALYEFGMFDFDQKELYYVLNNRKDTWCERVFAPFVDFEQLLRENDEKLYTLESKTPLRQMDVIIFTIPNELMYTNVLNMMNLGGIPTLKERRKEGFPLIIGTGNAVLNPKSMEDFIDLYIIGKPSVIINEIMDKYTSLKARLSITKEEILESLKDIEGVYIPGVTDEEKQIHMVTELDIDSELVPKYEVVPSIATIVDKTLVSLSRGCSRNCTMCTHKYAYGAPQYMNVDKGVLKTKKLIGATGNTDVMFMTNCYADYPGFPDIIYKLKDLDKPSVKKVSFMDVKLNKDNLWLLKYMDLKGDYPSIIIGGATESLRQKVGIDITESEVLDVARSVFEAGFDKIRLKFILGIPGETYEDFPKMLDIANKVCKVYKEVYAKSPDRYIVELNIYNFTAKPHTPTQWCAVNTADNLDIKAKYLIEKNKNENVIIVAEEGKQTAILTLLARGNDEVGKVIYEAFRQGAKFDFIPTLFDMENWEVALNKCGVDLKKYLEEQNYKLLLPWDNIVLKTPKEELRRIYLNKLRSEK